jgi:hypothetical protein
MVSVMLAQAGLQGWGFHQLAHDQRSAPERGRIPIDGFIYQVETGELIEIAEASVVGEVR